MAIETEIMLDIRVHSQGLPESLVRLWHLSTLIPAPVCFEYCFCEYYFLKFFSKTFLYYKWEIMAFCHNNAIFWCFKNTTLEHAYVAVSATFCCFCMFPCKHLTISGKICFHWQLGAIHIDNQRSSLSSSSELIIFYVIWPWYSFVTHFMSCITWSLKFLRSQSPKLWKSQERRHTCHIHESTKNCEFL